MKTKTNQPPASQPGPFKDDLEREWQPRFDFVKLRTIRDKLKVDFSNLAQIGRTWAELILDDLKLLDVIWMTIATGDGLNADEWLASGDVTKDDWLSAMGDGALIEAAREAVRDALENFTPPAKRKILRRGIAAVENGYRKVLDEAEAKMTTALEEASEKAVQAVRRGTRLPNAQAFSATSTNAGRSAKRTQQ